jgi:hypothetical protein
MSQGNTSFLTNSELIAQLTLNDELTTLEQQLLDRLILATEEVDRMDKEITRLQAQVPSDGGPISA